MLYNEKEIYHKNNEFNERRKNHGYHISTSCTIANKASK